MRTTFRPLLFLILTILVFTIGGCFGGGGRPSGGPSTPPDLPSPTDDVPDSQKGNLEGFIYEVTDNDQTVPAANAMITIEGHPGYWFTEPDGSFSITGIVEGDHLVTINVRGAVGSGWVTIEAGKTTHLTVEMIVPSVNPPEPQPGEGSITVITYPKTDGNGDQIGVTKILIQEYGNWNLRWSEDYSSSFIWQTYQWRQGDMPLNKKYTVTVEWADGSYNSDTIELTEGYPDQYVTIPAF